MRKIANSLYEPIIRVEKANGRLEVVALEKDKKIMLQLVNAGGSHTNSSVTSDDYIPPVLDITLSLLLNNKPKKLILQPEGYELDFKDAPDGRITVNIDRIDIHNVIEVVE